jgi:uroporphyrin-III C-methyltransferase/precorrin-2 dehydrogenase/sirohydrochlorin ferrochelatase
MNNLPLFFAMKDRPVVIAGGGLQAARKADLMVRAGCIVTIHATALNEDLAQFVQAGKITHITRAVVAADFDDCVIAVGASDDMPVNEALHALATAAGVPVNVVDRPELCDFILPAVVDRSPLLIAVSSGGAAPLLTRILKARFETMIPAAYGRLAAFAGSYRNRVRTTVTKPENRLRFWDRFFDGPIAESLFSGQEDQAASLMDSMLAEAAKDENTGNDGEVFLVGAGPGDPDLLTFRALRLMQKADVVLYDRLIGDGILNLVRRDAERIYVGKLPKDHIVPQEDISEMLVRLAQAGKRVLRLKGGDPFMFGRGGNSSPRRTWHPLSGHPRRYGRHRKRRLCRHPPDSSGPCAILRIRHRPRQGRRTRFELDATNATQPDRRHLHGINPIAGYRRGSHCPWRAP